MAAALEGSKRDASLPIWRQDEVAWVPVLSDPFHYLSEPWMLKFRKVVSSTFFSGHRVLQVIDRSSRMTILEKSI